MREINRRQLGFAISGAIALLADKGMAQGASELPIPNADAMDSDVRARLERIILKQALNPYPRFAAGPNPDPDYSEFWTEARPANMSDFLSSGGDPRMVERWDRIPPVQNTGFGEDHFHEITPDFGEQCNPDGCNGAQAANTRLTILAVEDGIMIEDSDFYQEVLKAFTSSQ